MKQGGGIHRDNVQLDPAAEGKEAVSSEVDAEMSNKFDNAVMEEVSCEVSNDSQADDSRIKRVEMSSAFVCRIKKVLIVNVNHLDYD